MLLAINKVEGKVATVKASRRCPMWFSLETKNGSSTKHGLKTSDVLCTYFLFVQLGIEMWRFLFLFCFVVLFCFFLSANVLYVCQATYDTCLL